MFHIFLLSPTPTQPISRLKHRVLLFFAEKIRLFCFISRCKKKYILNLEGIYLWLVFVCLLFKMQWRQMSFFCIKRVFECMQYFLTILTNKYLILVYLIFLIKLSLMLSKYRKSFTFKSFLNKRVNKWLFFWLNV